jgi:hypothetical protein
MTPAVAAALGLLAGVGGTVAAQRFMHYDEQKDKAAKKLLDAAKMGTLPTPELKKVAVAFGVESFKRKRKGEHEASRAYEQAMRYVAAQGAHQGSQFGGGFHLGDVLRDVGSIVRDPYLQNAPSPPPPYPPVFAPELYASGAYDYHRGDVGDYYPYPGGYRHPERHF